MFPIQKEIEDKEQAKPFFVDYIITANGTRSSGSIKYEPRKEKRFWSLLQMVVKDILEGRDKTYLNESYKDGFSRFRRAVKRDNFTLRWVEMDSQSSASKVNKQ